LVQAVIFDIDVTIIDSVDFHIQAWKRAFEKFGKEISYELIRPKIGKGADDMLPMFFSKDELHRLVVSWNNIVVCYSNENTYPK
jgi:beta-phosphoglucomutase-like phosphatase (HAD superfamily)